MQINLSGKVVLVMGIDDDVVESIVEKFTKYGANWGIMDPDIDELIKIETEINARPGGNVSNADDLANSECVKRIKLIMAGKSRNQQCG